MKFTVLIPAYNEENNVGACLESILNTGYSRNEYEVIVVDDGSTDRTPEVVKDFSRRHPNIRLVSKENAGRASALNAGLNHAAGEFILVTDADCTVDSNWFKAMEKALARADMVQGACLAKQVENFWEKIQYARDGLVKSKYLGVYGIWAVGANNGFRKKLAQKVGGFNEKTLNVTPDFINRLQKNHYSVVHDPDSIVYTRLTDSFTGYLTQRLRWMEFSPKETLEQVSLIHLLKLSYTYGIPLILTLSAILFLRTLNIIFLLLFPAAVLLDILLHYRVLLRMRQSEDRKWITYFILYSIVLTLAVRLVLIPYLVYRLIKPRSKPTFKTVYSKK